MQGPSSALRGVGFKGGRAGWGNKKARHEDHGKLLGSISIRRLEQLAAKLFSRFRGEVADWKVEDRLRAFAALLA